MAKYQNWDRLHYQSKNLENSTETLVFRLNSHYHWAQICQINQLTEGFVDWLTNVDIVLVLELISKLVMTGSLQNDILFGLSSIVNPVCFGLFSSLVLITEVELFVVVLVVVFVIVEMDNFFLLRLVWSWILFLLGEGSTEAVTATSAASLAFLPLGAETRFIRFRHALIQSYWFKLKLPNLVCKNIFKVFERQF